MVPIFDCFNRRLIAKSPDKCKSYKLSKYRRCTHCLDKNVFDGLDMQGFVWEISGGTARPISAACYQWSLRQNVQNQLTKPDSRWAQLIMSDCAAASIDVNNVERAALNRSSFRQPTRIPLWIKSSTVYGAKFYAPDAFSDVNQQKYTLRASTFLRPLRLLMGKGQNSAFYVGSPTAVPKRK